ncbi:amino acid transporter [Penicillium malachiteum]|uniref:Amino acid transporter n=1 Tax=Penicillium malachiteum TaxID=1324776 RepID=A0AAD6MU63_9EURO|nr:amino acid transporter [Penicillium malachiteum]
MSDKKTLSPETIDSKDNYVTPAPRQDEDLQFGDLKDNASNYDAVFGKLTQDGPNYRSVSFSPLRIVFTFGATGGEINIMSLDRMVWNNYFDAENPDWPGYPLNPICLQYIRYCTRSDPTVHSCGIGVLHKYNGWKVQTEPP